MPFNTEDHLDNLIRHIELVRGACILLGTRLIKRGEDEFGRKLIANGFEHDVSKFFGIEWDYLHAGNDVDKEKVEMAIRQHVSTNSHHPESWGGIEHMSDLALAECVCDWLGRSQEFGTCLRDWIEDCAIPKYKIDKNSITYTTLMKYVDILLENSFVSE